MLLKKGNCGEVASSVSKNDHLIGLLLHLDPRSFTKESVRSWSLKTLALLAELSQDQRRRVLEHALKVNRL